MTDTGKPGLKARLRTANHEERDEILNSLPYDVGFGKPPEGTRFAAGNQAGRRGRPKGSENLDTIVREEFDAKVEVTEGGKPRKLSKRRVALRQLANKAATGDIRSLAVYLDLLRKTGQLDKAPAKSGDALSADDIQAATDLLRFYAPADDSQNNKQGGTQ